MIAIHSTTTYALTVPPGPLTAAQLRELVELGASLLGLTLIPNAQSERTITAHSPDTPHANATALPRIAKPVSVKVPVPPIPERVAAIAALPADPPAPTPLCALTESERLAIRTMRAGGMTTHAIAETLGRELVDVNAAVTREVMGATGGGD